jgi:hypothetical protein
VGTLVIAAISSAAAATVVSRLWQAGTVMATAMTPVVVALVKEALERPAQRVSSIATRSGAPPVARVARAVVPPPPEVEAPPPPMAPDPQLTQMRVYGRDRSKVGRRWKLAVATGLLGFVVCVAVLTLPELVAGRSVVSGQHHTTIFGGHRPAPAAKGTTTDQSTGTTTTAPIEPTPQPAPTQPTPTQTQPTQPPPTTTEQQPAPTTP